MKHLYCLLWLVAVAPIVAAAAQDKPPLVEFKDGDRIALVGNDFFDRDQDREYIQTQLIARFPGKALTFRNLGYSGDTVWADARSLCSGWDQFGPPDQGFNRLRQLLGEIKPTLIFVAYGMNESFNGPRGLDHFVMGVKRMLDMIAATGARIVLVSPIRHEDLGRPLPDPASHNRDLQLYIAAMKDLAMERGHPFINLYDALGEGTKATPPHPFTSDGIHLTPYGYWRVAAVLEQAMGYQPRRWQIQLDASGTSPARGIGVRLRDVKADANGVSFRAIDALLPTAPPPTDSPPSLHNERVVQISGLSAGRYVLKCDEEILATASAEQWSRGVQLQHDGPCGAQEESLRKVVAARDFDYFNYWRAQNDTYILGYRKHEQGRNAVELPRFDELAKSRDEQIATLRKPVEHAYVLAKDGR